MDMKKVSIIVPAYNCAAYITKCMDSLVGQTYPALEILVVNDGSTDQTLSILEQYGDRITVVTKKNGGVAEARNTGLRRATGDFILFVDSDDYLDLDCVETVVRRQEESQADIVRFSYRLVYADGRVEPPIDYFKEDALVAKPDFQKHIYPYFLSAIRFNSVWATLYKREMIADLSFVNNMKTAEDAVFSLEAYTRAQTALLVTDVFYYYVQTSSGLTSRSLSLLDKYKCNFRLSGYILKKLDAWGMNTLPNRCKTCIRPVALTFHKLRRGIK